METPILTVVARHGAKALRPGFAPTAEVDHQLKIQRNTAVKPAAVNTLSSKDSLEARDKLNQRFLLEPYMATRSRLWE